MSAAAAPRHQIHDPFSPANTSHHTPTDETFHSILQLLAVDDAIDARSPSDAADTALLNDLLAVDLEFHRADVRRYSDVGTAPALKDEKALFLDLLEVDLEVDGAKQGGSSDGRRRATSRALHDPHRRAEHSAIERFAGIYRGGGGSDTEREEGRRLEDSVAMLHLLAVDDVVDDGERRRSLAASDDAAIFGGLHDVDLAAGGWRRRALLAGDLRGLLEVDRLADGAGGRGAGDGGAGKRSIFTARERCTAKVDCGFSG